MDLTIIIPICNIGGNDFSYRVGNLKKVLDCYPKDVTILIVEEVVDDKNEKFFNYVDIKDNIKYRVVRCDEMYKGWLYNIGVKESKTKYVCCSEVDCIPEDVDSYLSELQEYIDKDVDYIFGWKTIKYLKKNGEVDFVRNFPNNTATEGGLVFYKRDFYLNKMFGYSELLYKIGGGDNEALIRVRHLTKVHVLNQTVLHLYHPTSSVKITGTQNRDIYLLVKKVLNDTKNDPDLAIRLAKEHGIGLDVPIRKRFI